MPKTKQSKKGRGQKRNNDPLVKKPGALAEQDGRPKPYNIHRDGVKFKDEGEQKSSQLVDGKMTWKVMQQVKQQQKEEGFDTAKDYEDNFPSLGGDLGGTEEFDENDEQYEDVEGDECEEIIIDEEDDKTIQAFTGGGVRLNLADMIMKKIEEKKTEVKEIVGEEEVGSQLPEELVKHYSSVGMALSTYRSGKLPKTFKLIPRLTNWEDILDVMSPDKWSAAAMFQATRMFASNMSEGLVQRFYNVYLLPRIRDEIEFYKKLNFHMMQCLKKALYKPAAFFKGILIPLCQAGDSCTLREATIVCACLREHSIPPLHAAAGLLKIAEMDYNGVNSLFLRVLIEKKYALPFRVLDALVFHFLKFRTEKRRLPVLWHQSFLAFVEIYAADISAEQKEALIELLKHQYHPEISEEVRRQIVRTEPRDDEMEEPPAHIMEEMMNAI